jgi:oligopeptidase B
MTLLLLLLAASPPVAKKVPVRSELHGHVRVDDYAWLRDKGSKEVETYLTAEDRYTAEVTEPLLPLQRELYDEMVARVQQTDVSVPFREHGWLYYWRSEEDREPGIFCRRRTEEAPSRCCSISTTAPVDCCSKGTARTA